MNGPGDRTNALDGVQVLFPRDPDRLNILLDRKRRLPFLDEPFSASRIDDLDALSRALLENSATRREAACVALAYWLRKSSITAIAAAHVGVPSNPAFVRTCAGLVFHIAPSNVDTMFVYSWALAHLCGDASIVRLPSARNDLLAGLVEVFVGLEESRPGIARANAFISYGHDDAVTERLSLACDQRFIWGGNETVRRIRAVPLNPHAGERAFASKYSYCVADARRFLDAGAGERASFVSALGADLFPYDQKACSSPHTVFWVGGAEDYLSAAKQLDEALAAYARAKGIGDDPSRSSLRMNAAFEAVARGGFSARIGRPALTSLVSAADVLPERIDCGAGFLVHARLDELDRLADFADDGDQTVTHWGLDAGDVCRLARLLGGRGVDRVVPVGQALSFSYLWDGVDLVDELTRRVVAC